MVPQRLTGSLGVPAGNSLNDGPMVANNSLRFSGNGQVQAAQAVDMAALLAHQSPQRPDLDTLVQRLVKRLIGHGQLLDVQRCCRRPKVDHLKAEVPIQN